MHGMRTPQCGCADFAQADAGNLALAHALSQPRHRVLNRLRRVDAMYIVQVDLLDTEPAQRGLAALPRVCWTVVDVTRMFTRVVHDAQHGVEIGRRSLWGRE